MKKTLLILNLIVAVILSCAWIFPAYWAALGWFDWSVMSAQQRIDHMHTNSLPLPVLVKSLVTGSAEWLGAAALYWSLRFSIPPFFRSSGDTQSWKKPGLRLLTKEASLSTAILEERASRDDG